MRRRFAWEGESATELASAAAAEVNQRHVLPTTFGSLIEAKVKGRGGHKRFSRRRGDGKSWIDARGNEYFAMDLTDVRVLFDARTTL